MNDYRALYRQWCTDPYFDENTKKELAAIADDEEEIKDRFYRPLSFGTGGLRGVIAAGTNRMNIYTVRLATQGLANYILAQGGADRGVAIAFDSRIMSPNFATEAALVLNANGIKTYRFDSLRPTPELSFAVRKLSCIAGIVITASHNPREYNGYKVYWEDGAQITPPHDQGIMDEVKKVTSFDMVKTMSRDGAAAAGLFNIIGSKIDEAYLSELKRQSVHPEIIREMADDFTVVYTPLNGAGNRPVRRVLKELGFTKVHVVQEQEAPDGNFPTLPYPNPELPEAYTLALQLAEKVHADIILATDPDADRLGVMCYDPKSGRYIPFTGNMSGMLIAEYLLREHTKQGTLPMYPAIVETIVTTDMAKVIAEEYHVKLIEVLTGFKYIGEQIRLFEENHTYHFVFGLEESYGCLAGTYARDKDACIAVMLLCEVAAFYKKKNMTLWDAMIEMYEKYGYFREGQKSITLKGMDGSEKIRAIMENARKHPAKEIGGCKVLSYSDYLTDTRFYPATGESESTGLPKSNVLYYELENSTWCCVRPSGTEPKIKFYFGVKGTSLEDSQTRLDAFSESVMKMFAEEN